MADLEAQHARSENRGARAALRSKARQIAHRAGEPMPAWAQPRQGGRPAMLPGSPVHKPATKRRAIDLSSVAALSAWRAGATGRSWSLSPARVILIEYTPEHGERSAAFPSAAAALAAIRDGAIAWR